MKISLILPIVFVSAVIASPFQDFINGNTLFTASAYKEIAKTHPDNLLISPISAQIYLALLQSGARNETAEEIRAALHLPPTRKLTESALKVVVPTLNRARNSQMHTANKVYVKKNLLFKPKFKQVARMVYQAQLQNIDFTDNVEAAKTINRWVELQTENKIHDLIGPEEIGNNTVSLLVNAVYFKGTWFHIFPKNSSFKEKFYKSPEDVVEVEAMRGSNRIFKYCEDVELDAKFLELPLNGRDLSMVIVLPNKIGGIGKVEEQIEKVFQPHSFQYKFLEVTVPKFRIENRIEMKDVLINLGVDKAFKSGEADFSEIAGERGQLYVDNVIQKISIDVDESNTEAVANFRSATTKEHKNQSEPQEFNANHPFLFYVKMKNLILFGGRVSTPQQ